MSPMDSRPLLNVELNTGTQFKFVVLHSIQWFSDNGKVFGGWFSFTDPGREKTPVITDVDFDDIYEIKGV